MHRTSPTLCKVMLCFGLAVGVPVGVGSYWFAFHAIRAGQFSNTSRGRVLNVVKAADDPSEFWLPITVAFVLPPLFLTVWVGVFVAELRSQAPTAPRTSRFRHPRAGVGRNAGDQAPRCVGGYVFTRSADRLAYRRSWWPYAVGCTVSAVALAGAVVFALLYFHTHTVHDIGLGPMLGVPLLLVPLGYVAFGADDQRNPITIDLRADRVTRGDRTLCKVSAIRVIRLVEVRGPTNVYAKLSGPPWSIALGSFARFDTALQFGQEFGEFLNVKLHDDPLFPQFRRDRGAPGFPVVLPGDDKGTR